MRRLSVGLAGVGLVTAQTIAAASGAIGSERASPGPAATTRVLVLGVPGLRWDQVSHASTPALWAFAEQSARGALSVRSQDELTCPDAGWLTLGAGNRAADLGRECYDRPDLSDWAALVDRNDRALDDREIGALGRALVAAGTCGAADGPPRFALGTSAARPLGARGCELELRELPMAYAHAGLAAVDSALAATLTEADPRQVVIVAGISETDGGGSPHLHVLAIRGPGFPAGAELSSPSTSRAPYVQLIDLAPTALSLLGHDVPSSMSGRPVRAGGGSRALAADVRRLADLDRRATSQRAVVVPFTVLLVLALLVLVGLALAGRGRRWIRTAAVVVMAMPVASFLARVVPWWRVGPHQFLALVAVSIVVAGVISLLAIRGPWCHRPLVSVAVVAAATAVVLGADLVTGAHLQMDAVLGYSPYVAGRFVGIGNPGFAVFGSAAVLAAALLVSPARRAWVAVAGVGLVAVTVDGAPPWGDDFGGVLALVPAFVVVASLLATGSVRWSRLLLSAVGAAALVTGFALLDYARGVGHRTHLGRFVEQVRDGTAGQVIHRKAQANLELLTHSPFTLLVPLLLVTAIWLLVRPPSRVERRLGASPQGRAGLLGVLVLAIVGGLVNDSGTAIPAVALLLAVPVALVLGVSEVEPEAGA